MFSADEENSGTAHLFIGHGRPGPDPLTDSDSVAPGARSRPLSVVAETKGLMRVFVDAASENDTGHLTVAVDGHSPPKWAEDIKGNCTWLFTVIERPPDNG